MWIVAGLGVLPPEARAEIGQRRSVPVHKLQPMHRKVIFEWGSLTALCRMPGVRGHHICLSAIVLTSARPLSSGRTGAPGARGGGRSGM